MDPLIHKRQQILQEMERIQTMEHGSLQAETRPSKRTPAQNRGPYFKHQIWEKGQNSTRRIPPEKADALAEAIAGRKKFQKLAEDFIQTTVAMTRSESSPDSKKNAMKSKRPSKTRPKDTSKSS
jgi:hypothetical protein